MTETINAKYQKEVHNALEKCQFVEETLRVYMELIIRMAKLELSPHFPVRFTISDLSELPLGKLVTLYSRFSNNDTLKSLLKNITKERNFIAHRSLLFTLGELEDSDHMLKLIDKLIDIKERAKKIHEELLEETWRLRKAALRIERELKTKK